MPILAQGISDLEVRIGKEKIGFGNVVIADIDFNVLSCFSMQSEVGGRFKGQEFVCSERQDAFSDLDG